MGLLCSFLLVVEAVPSLPVAGAVGPQVCR